MIKYQVWLRGSTLIDVEAENDQDAREQVREMFGFKRLPNDTCVCKIPYDYYDQMVKHNQDIGIDITNM